MTRATLTTILIVVDNFRRNTVQLTLNIDDVNDNAPAFTQEKYEAKLMENQEDFNPPLFLEALDDDLNGI